jgi:hypothetical protein
MPVQFDVVFKRLYSRILCFPGLVTVCRLGSVQGFGGRDYGSVQFSPCMARNASHGLFSLSQRKIPAALKV